MKKKKIKISGIVLNLVFIALCLTYILPFILLVSRGCNCTVWIQSFSAKDKL